MSSNKSKHVIEIDDSDDQVSSSSNNKNPVAASKNTSSRSKRAADNKEDRRRGRDPSNGSEESGRDREDHGDKDDEDSSDGSVIQSERPLVILRKGRKKVSNDNHRATPPFQLRRYRPTAVSGRRRRITDEDSEELSDEISVIAVSAKSSQQAGRAQGRSTQGTAKQGAASNQTGKDNGKQDKGKQDKGKGKQTRARSPASDNAIISSQAARRGSAALSLNSSMASTSMNGEEDEGRDEQQERVPRKARQSGSDSVRPLTSKINESIIDIEDDTEDSEEEEELPGDPIQAASQSKGKQPAASAVDDDSGYAPRASTSTEPPSASTPNDVAIAVGKLRRAAPDASADEGERSEDAPRDDAVMHAEDDAETAGPSFLERLSQNLTPRFSKGFKGKAKSSQNTSIPLQDDRFDSESDDEGYESEGRPTVKRARRAKPSTSARKRKRSDDDLDAELEDDESTAATRRASQVSSGSRKKRTSGKTYAPIITTDEEPEPTMQDSTNRTMQAPSDSDSPDVIVMSPSSKRTKAAKSKTKIRTAEDSDSEGEDASEPELHASGSKAARKDDLRRLSASRKEKSEKASRKAKASKRVIATPSPTPPPASSARKKSGEEREDSPVDLYGARAIKKRVPSASRRKGKPLFARDGSSDDDEDAVISSKRRATRATSSGSDLPDIGSAPKSRLTKATSSAKGKAKGKDRTKSARHDAKTKKQKKKKSRRIADTSSSSDDGSAESGSEQESERDIDDEIAEDVEDIKLDYDTVRKDKLRPKDTSKLSRLDKLKKARQEKEAREARRRRGIIDSDEEEEKSNAPTVESSQSGSDDDESVPDLDDNEEDFIVEHEDDTRTKAEVRQELPDEYSKHGKLTLEQHFSAFIRYLAFTHFLPKDREIRNDREMLFSIKQVRRSIEGIIDSGIASSIWREEFRHAIDTRPDLEIYQSVTAPGCEGCNKHDRIASVQARFLGKTYDDEDWEDYESDPEVPHEEIFHLGRFCAEKCVFHHELKHFMYKTAVLVRELCEEYSTLPAQLDGDKDERRERRADEAERVLKRLNSSRIPFAKEQWLSLRNKLEMAKKKYLK